VGYSYRSIGGGGAAYSGDLSVLAGPGSGKCFLIRNVECKSETEGAADAFMAAHGEVATQQFGELF
jgi:hypothetical protein